MFRGLLTLGLVAALVIAGSVDLSACGDKFLRPGKSARLRRYAAVHPASILIYRPVNATPKGIKDLEALLKRAGHTPRSIASDVPLSETVSGGHYDLVIAAYADAGRVKEAISSLPSRPEVLPILHQPEQAVVAAAENEYPFLLKPHAMTNIQALEEIDHLMNRKLHGAAAGAASR